MNIVKSAYNGVVTFLKTYPGGTAGVTTAIVALAATFGLHVSVDQLAALTSVIAVLAGVVVHSTTVPKPAPLDSVVVRVPAPVVDVPAVESAPVAELVAPTLVIGPGAPVPSGPGAATPVVGPVTN